MPKHGMHFALSNNSLNCTCDNRDATGFDKVAVIMRSTFPAFRMLNRLEVHQHL